MSVDSPKFDASPAGIEDISERLRRFVDTAGSFEASADDIVRVRVGGTMNVISVELLEPGLDREIKQRLETAIVGAVNAALQRAALAAGETLAEFEGLRPR